MGLFPPNGKAPSWRGEASPWTQEARETQDTHKAIPQSCSGGKALQEVRRRHSGVAYRLFRIPKSNFPCFTTQTGFLLTLLEMASVNPTVPWCVIYALFWLNRHLFMSFWKTHTTNGFLNSQPCAVNVGSIWGSGEKERAALIIPN